MNSNILQTTQPIWEEISWQDLSLCDIDKKTWALLEWSAQSHRGPFHIGTIGSMEMTSLHPQIRNVVLRNADVTKRSLCFHTDKRSPKWTQLSLNPNLSWLFYHPVSRVQLRLEAIAHIHHNDNVCKQAWNHSRLSSKLCYAIDKAPGTVIDAPVLNNLSRKFVSERELLQAEKNFSVIETIISKMDWLYLCHKGHIRASFNYETGVNTWIQV